jgi:hypothetical protein
MGSSSIRCSTSRATAIGWADPLDPDEELRNLLRTLSPKARDDLRRVLIRDHDDRDAISSRLMRHRDQTGDDWADIIDFLSMHPEGRRRIVRLLAEIDAR